MNERNGLHDAVAGRMIEIEHVSKRFGKVVAVDNLSFLSVPVM
jgi:hypothetical protein